MQKMTILFVAPPLGGKGTQMELLKGFLESRGEEVLEVGTGNFFRNLPDTTVARMIKKQMAEGHLINDVWPNAYVANLFKDQFADQQIIFDGYPRNIKQADFLLELLDSICRLDTLRVVYLHVHKLRLKKRLERRIQTTGRPDDTPESFKVRFTEYLHYAKPIIQFFSENGVKIIPISGHTNAEHVFESILSQLGLFE